jgi:hypothetical protein
MITKPLKPSEIIMIILIGLLIVFSIMNKMRSNMLVHLVHDGKYNHVIKCNQKYPLNIEDCVNKYWIEADTVDNTIFYRLYWKEKHKVYITTTKHTKR